MIKQYNTQGVAGIFRTVRQKINTGRFFAIGHMHRLYQEYILDYIHTLTVQLIREPCIFARRPMATRTSIASSSLGDQLNCAVCLERFTDPRTLPCHHSFCLRCLHGVPHQQGEDHVLIKCPTCRKSSQLPEGGTDQLPKAFLINNLLELQKQEEHDQEVCTQPNTQL